MGCVLGQECQKFAGRRVDEALVADDDGGYDFVAIRMLSHDCSISIILPNVVLDSLDTELVQATLQARAEPTARPPVEIDLLRRACRVHG